MKFTAVTIASLAAVVAALPTDIKYGPPKGGWESIDWTKVAYPEGTGANLPKYPPGTGENLPKYPPGTGENLPKYPGTGENKAPSGPAPVGSPFTFTSYFEVRAVPEQVVNGTTPTGGLKGASGLYKFGLNSHENVICYNITFYHFDDIYQSPARTATHVHEAGRGQSGPPRIAFENPVDIGNGLKRSIGCAKGPFTTGVLANNVDTGAAFQVSSIEKNPAGFFADVHSSRAVPGAVRGQLA